MKVMCLKKNIYYPTHTKWERERRWESERKREREQHTHTHTFINYSAWLPPCPSFCVCHPTIPLSAHPAVAMVLPQPLWYPGYNDTFFILIGCELCRGGHACKCKDREGEKERRVVFRCVFQNSSGASFSSQRGKKVRHQSKRIVLLSR